MTCNCAGFGYYKDDRCAAKVCAHRERYVTNYEVLGGDDLGKVPEKTRTKIPRVMDCPKRPCSCAAGLGYRSALRERILAQEQKLKTAGVF